jgi:hypothetical protein
MVNGRLRADAGIDEVTNAKVGAEDLGGLVAPADEVGTGGADQTSIDIGGLVGLSGLCERPKFLLHLPFFSGSA